MYFCNSRICLVHEGLNPFLFILKLDFMPSQVNAYKFEVSICFLNDVELQKLNLFFFF